jgi:GAF domain-containing protein
VPHEAELAAPVANAEELLASARALIGEERDAIANAASLASLLYFSVSDLNWCGFYFRSGDELVVGPFVGRPACIRIALGNGVCGKAFVAGTTIVVEDVMTFPGHIACDPASRSEIVVPLTHDGDVVGVLDVDSPRLRRFGVEERAMVEGLARLWSERSQMRW